MTSAPGVRETWNRQVVYEFLPAIQADPFVWGNGLLMPQQIDSGDISDLTFPDVDQLVTSASQLASPEAYKDGLVTSGYTVTEYTEAAWYALAPWPAGTWKHTTRREQVILPVGPKLSPCWGWARYTTRRTPGSHPLNNSGWHPDEASYSDLATGTRRLNTQVTGSAGIALPPVVEELGAGQYLEFEGVGVNAQYGRRGYSAKAVQAVPFGGVTWTGPISPTIDIQGVGPTAFTNIYRAQIAIFASNDDYEPVAVVAGNTAYFEMLELNTETVRDSGYIDAGLVADDDGGFAFRWDPSIGVGTQQGIDVYLNDTPLNAAVIANSGNATNIAVNWATP